MAKQKKIPFVPKMSRNFKSFRYCCCVNPTNVRYVTRAAFMQLLVQQPYPMAQVNIDFEEGVAYLVPYDENRAEGMIQLYRDFDAEYRRFLREQERIRAGKQLTVLHIDAEPDDEDEETPNKWTMVEDGPETFFIAQEKNLSHSKAFSLLTESDQQLLKDYMNVDCNARELARRQGKDHRGVQRLLQRAGARLQKIIEENY